MADFSWAAASDVGLGVLGGLSKGVDALGRSMVANANASAAATVRAGQNEVRRSAAGLAATIKGINDKRMMEAASERRDAFTTTALRTQDAFVNRDFENSIKGAEALGRAAASGAAAGIGGAGIQAISQTTQLQLDRQKQALAAGEQDVTFDEQQGIASVIPQALRGLSTSPLILGYDNSATPAVATPNIAGAMIAGLLDKRASLQTLLGSLQDSPAAAPGSPAKASFAFEATTSPVAQSNVTGTDLAPLVGTTYQDRSDRLLAGPTAPLN